MNKLKPMAILAISAAALLAAAVWAGGAAEADDDRFRFADCSVEFVLQDGRFVAVDGRSWAEVDPAGECHEAPISSISQPADSSEDAPSEADEPTDIPVDSAQAAADDAAPQGQQDGPPGNLTCLDVVKPETGPALISFQENDHCAIVRDGGAVQVSRGDYTLNVTLPAREWSVSPVSHPRVGDAFFFSDHTTYIHGWVYLNAADGVEISRYDDGWCEYEQVIVEETIWFTADGARHRHTVWAAEGDILWCTSTLLDAIVASVTVPAAE